MRLRDALESSRRAIHFYCCGQVDWQEYSELTTSAFLISSALRIDAIDNSEYSRNSEYRKVFR